MVAEQQHVVDDRPDPFLGRLDEPEPEVAGASIDPVEVLGDGALRCQDLNRGAVGELSDPLVVLITETDGVGQPIDRGLRSGQEMPARGGLGPSVSFEVGGLLL